LISSKLSTLAGTVEIPDPMLAALKAAINWSCMCGQQLLPDFPDGPKIDAEEAELYELAREQYEDAYEASIRPSAVLGDDGIMPLTMSPPSSWPGTPTPIATGMLQQYTTTSSPLEGVSK
jgi:hypothetical protein